MSDAELVAAGLVHDIADIAFPHDHRDHASVGAALVGAAARRAGRARLVGAHVEAKRYLVATDPAYRARLSPRSIETLALQGDGLDRAELAASRGRSRSRRDPHAAARRRASEGSQRIAGRTRDLATAARKVARERTPSTSSSSAAATTGSSRPVCSRAHGARVTVLERRPQVGGAATTEQPWGPDYKVTALSYVV